MDWCALALAAIGGGFVGLYVGTMSERSAWVLRAFRRDRHAPNTPHHCDGEFYYIVPENIFCEDFQRKTPATPSE